MEQQKLCTSANNEMIVELSKALVKAGIEDGAQFYYEADDYPTPYFKIPKAFKKESPEDPDFHYIYIDIEGNEYTVHGSYVHEHLGSAAQVVELVNQLYSGKTVEVALVYPDRMAGFFMRNTGDPQKNVDVINENAKTIMEFVDSPIGASPNTHIHTLFSPAHPYMLLCGGIRKPQIQGVTIYLVSYVFAEHPEYYVIR